jgi:hypothetical protein
MQSEQTKLMVGKVLAGDPLARVFGCGTTVLDRRH